MRRRRIVVAAATGTLGLGLAAPLAALADTAPPPGTASGTGASVSAGGQPIVAVSPTQASAGPDGSSASAYTVQVAGNNVTPGGSSQNGAAPAEGSAISTPAGSPVDASVAQYQASSGSGGAEGQATLAHVATGGPSGLSADVLRSDSKAGYGSSRSTGDSSTDGAIVDAGGPGGLSLDVLHSESHSVNGAGSYVVSINGTEIGTSQDVGKICSSLSNSLLQLACVAAGGGEAFVGHAWVPNSGSGGSALGVLLLDAAGASGPAVSPAVSTSSQPSGAAGANPAPTAARVALPVVQAGPAAAVVPSSTTSGSLPFTGAPLEFYVLVSAALLALGGVVWKLSTVVRPTFQF